MHKIPQSSQKQILELHPPLYSEIVGDLVTVNSTNDIISLVISTKKDFIIHIPRHLVVSSPPLLKPNDFITILKTDTGYIIQTHSHNHEHHASDRSKPLTGDDIESSLRRADNE